MSFQVIKASKVKSKARIGIAGPAGSGKTYSALSMGSAFGKIVVIDTENETSAKYSHKFEFDIIPFSKPYSPRRYIEAIEFAEKQPCDLIVIDSITHAWAGIGGALEMVDNAANRYSGNRFAAWRDVTPEHNKLVDAFLHCKKHLIVTIRSKQAYEIDKDEFTGRMVVRKLGLAPIQREGLDYEFDIVGDADMNHNWTISKTRCEELDGKSFNKPGPEVGMIIKTWLEDGLDPVKYAKAIFMSKHNLKSWSEAEEIIGIPEPTTPDEWEAADVLMSGMV